mmetsp:Transcript_7151/g.22876  ORF Transcript_7151/g.22876 Transcript_7151/m.22876 type:complete len:262 (-) Transcript_7151:149-934(-)
MRLDGRVTVAATVGEEVSADGATGSCLACAGEGAEGTDEGGAIVRMVGSLVTATVASTLGSTLGSTFGSTADDVAFAVRAEGTTSVSEVPYEMFMGVSITFSSRSVGAANSCSRPGSSSSSMSSRAALALDFLEALRRASPNGSSGSTLDAAWALRNMDATRFSLRARGAGAFLVDAAEAEELAAFAFVLRRFPPALRPPRGGAVASSSADPSESTSPHTSSLSSVSLTTFPSSSTTNDRSRSAAVAALISDASTSMYTSS